MIFSGQKKQVFTAVVLAGLLAVSALLSGCGYTLVSTDDLMALNQSLTEEDLEEQAEKESLEEQQLEEQLLSVLNLGAEEEEQVVASTTLDTASSFFMELVLEQMEEGDDILTIQRDLNNLTTMKESSTFAFVYDGSLSAAQVGKNALSDITERGKEEGVGRVCAINVNHETQGRNSAWLILAQYET